MRLLADYAPTAAITGHGPPMRGPTLQQELQRLSSRFDELARPKHGRYVDRPAVMDERGVVDVPPPVVSGRTVALTGLAVGAAIGLGIALSRRGEGKAAVADLSSADAKADDLGTELAAYDGGFDASSYNTRRPR